MRGAEVALLADTRLKVGSSADCDIVINDASLAPFAFELDVSESVVMLIGADGTQTQLKLFEIHDFGTTAIAIGPADQPWEELVRPAPEAVAAKDPAETAAAPAPMPPPTPAADPGKRRSHGGLVVILLVLLLLLGGAWWWSDRLFAWAQERLAQWQRREPQRSEIAVRPALTLRDIAEQYRLLLGEEQGVAVLSGNLRRRTERLAIRALALAADPGCRLRLTDDETMLKASGELLFAYTDGTIRATAASNRVVTIVGHAPDAFALERALRTLNHEVVGIERVDASGVMIGGKPVASEATAEKAPFVGGASETTPLKVPPVKQPARDYPIAGILTSPYPCVVMRDGQRVMEGALIGTAVLVKIGDDSLRLRDGGTEFEWRP